MVEAADYTGDGGFWQSMYSPLEKASCYSGMYGLIHNNTTVSLGKAAGDDVEPNIENRDDQCGFMDACFTPQSMRSFVMGISIRIMTNRTISIAQAIDLVSHNDERLEWAKGPGHEVHGALLRSYPL
ncbi:unnamed protein product [Zymoseptoria tritici ST99CH_1A5]|uniref:Uncharacterized protein n=2 Tax=Zymoseptoria tritici TaxID=1047171 RepID=A0A1Y6M3L6_ZYMTR|nr:unnamed protein product [Zymoseptoria tritici ST99CH_1A5]